MECETTQNFPNGDKNPEGKVQSPIRVRGRPRKCPDGGSYQNSTHFYAHNPESYERQKERNKAKYHSTKEEFNRIRREKYRAKTIAKKNENQNLS